MKKRYIFLTLFIFIGLYDWQRVEQHELVVFPENDTNLITIDSQFGTESFDMDFIFHSMVSDSPYLLIIDVNFDGLSNEHSILVQSAEQTIYNLTLDEINKLDKGLIKNTPFGIVNIFSYPKSPLGYSYHSLGFRDIVITNEKPLTIILTDEATGTLDKVTIKPVIKHKHVSRILKLISGIT